MHIQFSITQRDEVFALAQRRQTAAEQRKRPNTFDCEMVGLEAHKQGAAAELAVHLATGLPWNAFLEKLRDRNGRKLADVGDDLQVRGTLYQTGKLIVHTPESDPCWDRYILGIVRPDFLEVRLAGWRLGMGAQERKYWESLSKTKERFAFCVPQSDLLPMSALVAGRL